MFERPLANHLMIKEAFLVIALALPVNPKVKELKELRDFIQKNSPGARVWIGPHPQNPEIGWEKFPLMWRDNPIWIKRKPVSDRRSS